MDLLRIGIMGGGGWGLALAKLLAGNGHSLTVWEYDSQHLTLLRETHSNPILLKGITLPDSVAYTGDFDDFFAFEPDYIIIAVPSQYIRSTLRSVSELLWIAHPPKGIILVSKGIELNSNKLMHQVLKDELPAEFHQKIYALSGPSHAEEVARGVPTTVVIAGDNDAELIKLQAIFSNSFFRTYRSHDLIGVEIGGAVKNIIAIAAGIIKGIGFGDNTIGALLSRGIVEIQRLGLSLGARPETFLGLSGIGDLITTATSEHSRNRYVGYEIGKGRKLSEIISGMSMVAEGVTTTKSVYDLAVERQVEMPIVTQVYQILYEDKPASAAIKDLMLRDLKSE